jgi:hypothetical protein
MPDNAIADVAACWRWETSKPAAQKNADASSRSSISGSIAAGAPELSGHAISATPARPGSNPANVSILARGSLGADTFKSTIQNGTVASMTAARPEGTYCCA